MNELPTKYDVSKRELARGRNLKIAAFGSPIVLTVLPAAVSIFLFFLLGSTPPVAASILFLGLIITAVGFVKGMIISAIMTYKYSKWSAEMRERIAADGIKANEIEWFTKELKPQEKKALKDIERSDLLLGDAYRETLASRLTASRIIRSSKKELLLTKRRESKIKLLKSEKSPQFLDEFSKDAAKLTNINQEAQQMLIEAESRLQLIESAALRGGSLAASELALKRLSTRAQTLPLALEKAKMADEIRTELEKEDM
ncbi:hypothetical protein BH24ACI3_BH24ACI3_17220 [soil metagenome]